MILINFLIFSVVSTLKSGDDPYEILNIDRTATDEMIRKTYKKLVFKYHPDLNKDEASHAMFVKINDAYELLSNPYRKKIFDTQGIVNIKEYDGDDRQNNDDDESKYYTYKNRDYVVPLLNQMMFEKLVKDSNEWILFVYQHFDCSDCASQEKIFDEIGKSLNMYVSLGKLEATSSPDLVEKLKVKTFPQIIHVKYISDDNFKVKKIANKFKNPNSGIKKIFKVWGCTIKSFEKEKNFNLWLQIIPDKTHIVLVVNPHIKNTPITYFHCCKTLKERCMFSTIPSSILNVTLTDMKNTLFIYRGHNTDPRRIVVNEYKMINSIEEFEPPVFPKLNWRNFKVYSGNWLIMCVGVPNRDIIEEAVKHPFSTGYTEPGSLFASNLKLNSGNWAIISADKMKIWKIEKINDSAHFFSVCTQICKSNNIESIFGPGMDITEKEIKVGQFGESYWYLMPFTVSNGNIIANFAPVSIPVPTVLTISLIIAVLLFFRYIFLQPKAPSLKTKERVNTHKDDNIIKTPTEDISNKHEDMPQLVGTDSNQND